MSLMQVGVKRPDCLRNPAEAARLTLVIDRSAAMAIWVDGIWSAGRRTIDRSSLVRAIEMSVVFSVKKPRSLSSKPIRWKSSDFVGLEQCPIGGLADMAAGVELAAGVAGQILGSR